MDAQRWRAGGGVPPKGKAIRRPDRRGGVNGVSDWKVECLRSIMVEALLPDIIRIKLLDTKGRRNLT